MPKLRKLMLGGLLAALPAVAPADEVPIIEIAPGPGQNPSSATYGAAAGSQEAQLLLMVQQLQDEVRMLRGQVESQRYELDRMKNAQDERYRDLDRRMSLLITGGGVASAAPGGDTELGAPGLPDSTQAALPAPSVPSAPNTGVTTDNASAEGADAAYQAAFGLVRERQFDQAAAAFERFVLDYPASSRVPNAHYWLGEIYLAQQKLEASQKAFLQVVEHYAGNPKVPDALYKLGVLQDQLGNGEQSAHYMEQVIREYPNTSAARLAQNYKR
ncbi:tol-pal system protein YbgF [Marinobacterium nitratireducens]|uniref:Cell division coordinator CpoB n=1 Tax=Marinobacterium nitratireducens TaxID=518897 RepID=A0A917ZEU7_9GAMM|nr:tol-pal system protein YbgF [Marinobacterium nitratireducens]GGO80674.1 tol-pal system protein YbgF [Marinobacterium nitratireducens]